MKYESGIAAIALVIMVVIILLTLMGGLVLLTTTGYKSYQFSKDRAQALYPAEAGISQALREIKGDGYLPGDEYLPVDYDGGEIELIPQTSLGDGSYSVRCTATMPSRGGSEHGSLGGLDDPKYYLYQLTSTGDIKGVSRQVEATYKVTIDIEEFNHIASYTSSCNITEAYQTPVLPSPIMEFFRNNADYIYESGFISDISAELNGVYYVQGEARLQRGTILQGTIVVEGGNLTVEKQCQINPSNNPDLSKRDFPAIVVYGETGKVIIEKGNKQDKTEINGLIYASSSVTIHENCEVTGVIIADEVTMGSDNGIEYQAVSPPGFWGGTSSSGGTTRKVSLEPETWQSS